MSTDPRATPRRFLIAFDDGAMDHIPDDAWPAVDAAARRVMREAKAAGAWIFGCGIARQRSTIVAGDGTVAAGPSPGSKAVPGGFSILQLSTREEAHAWAARFAAACRCPQEVREILFDPES